MNILLSRFIKTPIMAFLMGSFAAGALSAAAPTASLGLNKTALFIGETAVLTVTFSEAVTGFANDDITVENGFITTVATTDNITWTATLSPGSGVNSATNKITLNLATLTSTGGTPGVGTAVSANYSVNTVLASVSGVAFPADGRYEAGRALSFVVTYSRAVAVTGTPRLSVPLDTGKVYADYSSGSGTTALTFTYNVNTGDQDATGFTLGSSIDLNGGTIDDNEANYPNRPSLTLAGTTSTTTVFVDTLAPVINAITRLDASPTNATTVRFRVIFSEPITGAAIDDFILTRGPGVTGDITKVTGSTGTKDGAETGTTLDVEVTNVGGTASGALRLDVKSAATFKDLSNRDYVNAAAYTSGDVYTVNAAPAAAPVANGFGSAASGGSAPASTIPNANNTVTAYTADDFLYYAESANPYVITLINSITLSAPVHLRSNKTIQGHTASTAIVGNLTVGITDRNIVIRGLQLTNPTGSAINLTGARDVFITHCTFFDCANEAITMTAGTDLVTVSWCEFYNSPGFTGTRPSVLIGGADIASEPVASRVTLHHNFWSTRVVSNMPAINRGTVHFYNNYINTPGNTSGTTVGATAQLLAERNVYLSVANPLTKDSAATAKITTVENTYTSVTGTAPYSGTDSVFTPPYSYQLHPAANVANEANTSSGNLVGAASTTPAVNNATISGPTSAVGKTTAFTLKAVPNNFTPTAYQWRRGNTPISGATTSEYAVKSASETDGGTYNVALTLSSGEVVVSAPITLTIGDAPTTTPTETTAGGGAPSLGFLGLVSLLSAFRFIGVRRLRVLGSR